MWHASAAAPAHRRVRRRARRGVSLLEAVAALAIVGVTSASVLTVAGAGVRTAERARRAHEATALAQETLARISLLDEASLLPLPDSLRVGTFAPPFADYDWDAAVRADASRPGLYTVDVTVQWEGGGQTLTTAVYRRPRRVREQAP